MSSRRSASEENILAMLERDAVRRSGSRMSPPRLTLYSGAALLTASLIGGLVWIALQERPVAAQSSTYTHAAPAATNVAAAPLPLRVAAQAAQAVPVPLPVSPAAQAAVLVDERRPAAPAQPSSAVPPLVLLTPQEGAPIRPAARPPGHAAAPTAAAAPTPTPMLAAARKVRPASPAPASSTRKPDLPGPKKAQQSAPANPRLAKATARPKSNPTASAAQVDSDVALISAIIAQAPRHRNESEARPARP